MNSTDAERLWVRVHEHLDQGADPLADPTVVTELAAADPQVATQVLAMLESLELLESADEPAGEGALGMRDALEPVSSAATRPSNTPKQQASSDQVSPYPDSPDTPPRRQAAERAEPEAAAGAPTSTARRGWFVGTAAAVLLLGGLAVLGRPDTNPTAPRPETSLRWMHWEVRVSTDAPDPAARTRDSFGSGHRPSHAPHQQPTRSLAPTPSQNGSPIRTWSVRVGDLEHATTLPQNHR